MCGACFLVVVFGKFDKVCLSEKIMHTLRDPKGVTVVGILWYFNDQEESFGIPH